MAETSTTVPSERSTRGSLRQATKPASAARVASETALELYREPGDDEGVAGCLNALGVYERIAEDVVSPEHQLLMTALRLTLAPADLQRARAEGQLMTLNDLLQVLMETRH